MKKFLPMSSTEKLKYNPPLADLSFLYPEDGSSEEIYDNRIERRDFSSAMGEFKKDEQVLNNLLPTVIPADSYFQPAELAVLNSKDHPLRFPPRYYISKILFLIYFQNK